MIRVLLVHSSAGHYGADRQLALLATTFDRRAVEPVVLLPFDGPLGDDLRAAGVEVRTGPLPVVRREHLTPLGLAGLARDLRRARPALAELARDFDVVHANTSVLLGLPRPLVVHVREIYPRVALAWPAHRHGILAADRVVCVSEAVRAALGTSAPHVRVIPDGLAVAPRRADRTAARKALGLPADAFVAAVLGRISGWKGQQLLGQALEHVDGALGLVAGDAWPGQEHHEAALRGFSRLRLLGFRPDVETVYGAADVVVVPSTAPDPLPNSALEAAAAGCCVVAAAHGGLPEILADGGTGRLFPPGDAGALAAVLRELAADPAQRDRLGAAAAADVRARYDPGHLAPAITAVYREVVGKDEPRPNS